MEVKHNPYRSSPALSAEDALVYLRYLRWDMVQGEVGGWENGQVNTWIVENIEIRNFLSGETMYKWT